jgi:hypothetical protein
MNVIVDIKQVLYMMRTRQGEGVKARNWLRGTK